MFSVDNATASKHFSIVTSLVVVAVDASVLDADSHDFCLAIDFCCTVGGFAVAVAGLASLSVFSDIS